MIEVCYVWQLSSLIVLIVETRSNLSKEGLGAGWGGSCLHSQEAEKPAFSWLYPFTQSGSPAHGVMPSVCRVSLCTSVNLDNSSGRPRGDSRSVKLTVAVNHYVSLLTFCLFCAVPRLDSLAVAFRLFSHSH